MKFSNEDLKKKIIYRSNYRGSNEMDTIMSSFVNKYINELTKQDLVNLEKLLDIDDNNLYNFYNNLETDFKIEDNNVSSLFKNFKYEQAK